MSGLYCQDNARYRQYIGASMDALIDQALVLETSVNTTKSDVAVMKNVIESIENLLAANIKSGVTILGLKVLIQMKNLQMQQPHWILRKEKLHTLMDKELLVKLVYQYLN